MPKSKPKLAVKRDVYVIEWARFSTLKTERGMSNADVASKALVSLKTISKIKGGESVSMATVRKIATALKVTVPEILPADKPVEEFEVPKPSAHVIFKLYEDIEKLDQSHPLIKLIAAILDLVSATTAVIRDVEKGSTAVVVEMEEKHIIALADKCIQRNEFFWRNVQKFQDKTRLPQVLVETDKENKFKDDAEQARHIVSSTVEAAYPAGDTLFEKGLGAIFEDGMHIKDAELLIERAIGLINKQLKAYRDAFRRIKAVVFPRGINYAVRNGAWKGGEIPILNYEPKVGEEYAPIHRT